MTLSKYQPVGLGLKPVCNDFACLGPRPTPSASLRTGVRMTRPGEEQRPMYLTEVGRRHLEDRLGEYGAQRARLTAQSTDPTDVQDSVDQSDRLEAADELARLDDQIALVQNTLRRALPLQAGATDGVIRLGSTVQVRDDDQVESSFTLLDPAELERIDEAAAI